MPFGGHDAAELGARDAWIASFAEQAGIEEGPEPGDEEHHFGSDEHDHAVAQMQRHHAGVVTLVAFLDRVGPPGAPWSRA